MIMIEDLGGYYHPPHAIVGISYLVESDRPQIFKNLQSSIWFPIKWKRLLAPTRSLFCKWFIPNFYLFVISFFWNLVIKIFCQKETTNYRYLIKLFATTNINFYKIFLFHFKKISILSTLLYLKRLPISCKFI